LKHLRVLNKYFWKYRWHFSLGVVFIVASNYFAVLAPQITGYVVNQVEYHIRQMINLSSVASNPDHSYDPLVQWIAAKFENLHTDFVHIIIYASLILLLMALLRGFFMFLMRQTIIVMSRHIEYDQKNEIYTHYQQLDAQFYKTHSTGDLMSRMAEDVSRVRMYTGPSVMHLIHLSTLISLSLFYMFRKNWELTLYILTPLPILAVAIYLVNNIINKKSEQIQAQLSDLTTNAQESFAGIRVIKSFVQEAAMFKFFQKNSEDYRQSAVNLASVEAIYYPSIGLLMGISTLLTICIGGVYQMQHKIAVGTIAEFVVYINMLTFPVSALGWVASMIQRASASQKRLNDFLEISSSIKDDPRAVEVSLQHQIQFHQVNFTFEHTGIHALKDFNLTLTKGQKIAIIGKTGSGKSTIAQLLLRLFDPQNGDITIDGTNIKQIKCSILREQIGYVPQDVFLFSDTISNNIGFGLNVFNEELVENAAIRAHIKTEIMQFPEQFQTLVGERGVMLSGGQKQRISIARALIKNSEILIFDDCLSAVDAQTEQLILQQLAEVMKDKTALIITHRIFSLLAFDQVVVLDDGRIIEQGTHVELLEKNGYYADLFRKQQESTFEKNA
jgi:ATP-binding cassette subfamily B protein